MNQPVYTLLCHKDMPMASITLPKILNQLLPTQVFIVLDDGSFTDDDVAYLLSFSEKVQVIRRREREEAILENIKHYPQCIRYRNEFPFAFKLLDIPLLAKKTEARFTYTDSDIVYYPGSQGYFNLDKNTHLRTDAIKLSVKLRSVFFKYRWEIPFKFNAGYLCYDAQDFDLDFVEYYLGLPDVRSIPWLSEQTCWALIFGRSGPSFCPDEDQYQCRENLNSPAPGTKAIHLIGDLKCKVRDWADWRDSSQFGDSLRFAPSRNITWTDWAKKSITRLGRGVI